MHFNRIQALLIKSLSSVNTNSIVNGCFFSEDVTFHNLSRDQIRLKQFLCYLQYLYYQLHINNVLFLSRQTTWIKLNQAVCVCRFLFLSPVKFQWVKTDWVPGWQVRWAQPHRFITSWQSGALQGTAVAGNSPGLLINILSPPFSYTQTWHVGWPGPPHPWGKTVFLNNESESGKQVNKRKTIFFFSFIVKEKWKGMFFTDLHVNLICHLRPKCRLSWLVSAEKMFYHVAIYLENWWGLQNNPFLQIEYISFSL